MPNWRMKTYIKAFFMSIILNLKVIVGANFLQASTMVPNDEGQSFPPETVLQVLQKGIVYHRGDFPSEEDTLTGISSTPCYKGKGQISSIPVRYGKTYIPAVIVEDEKPKVVNPSELPHEQKALVRNVDRRHQVEWPRTQEWPYRVQGHLIMEFPHGRYTGSGTLIGPRHVLTAGHNLYDPRAEQWATKVLFAPGRHEDQYPFGDYKGCVLLTHEKWREKGDEQYDVGMVILDSAIGTQIGWLGLLSFSPVLDHLSSNHLLKEWPVLITGYPADKGTGDYYSTQMWEMRNEIKDVTEKQLFYDIDTWEGQSGSAVWGEYLSREGYYTVGVHTYKEKEYTRKGNRGTRLSEEVFNLILNWLRTYQREGDLSTSSHAFSQPLALTPLIFPDELRNRYASWVKGAEEGSEEDLYHIGLLYRKGENIQKDVNKAFACFYQAAEKGHGPALTALGLWYEQGERKDLLKAISLYQQAARGSNAEAMRRLGLLYLEGKGLPKKVETAIAHLKRASERGDREACYQLGRLYDEDMLVTPSKATAALYYQQAEKMGYVLPAEIHPSITFLTDEEVRSKAFTNLFNSSLQEVKNIETIKQQSSLLTLFICYDTEDTSHLNQVVNLACDLVCSGIPEKNIYLEKWIRNITIHQHANRVFLADKILVIGSPGLKEKYERKEGGRGISSQQIENLLTRITQQGVEGIIPLWFQGQKEECFPETLQNIPQRFLGGDYFNPFFDLLEQLYELNPLSNPLMSIRVEFENKRVNLTCELLEAFRKNLEDIVIHNHAKTVEEIKNILGI